jgi:hypothetical protein
MLIPVGKAYVCAEGMVEAVTHSNFKAVQDAEESFLNSDVLLVELQSLIEIAACRGQVAGDPSSGEGSIQVGQKFDAVRTHLYLDVGWET